MPEREATVSTIYGSAEGPRQKSPLEVLLDIEKNRVGGDGMAGEAPGRGTSSPASQAVESGLIEVAPRPSICLTDSGFSGFM
jgi:hypothetical protein